MQKLINTEIYGILPSVGPEIEPLAKLALDMRWSWSHESDTLWQQLDPGLWELTHNPWLVLQTVSREKLEAQLAVPAFKQKINELVTSKELTASQKGWFRQAYPESALSSVAYFSMEYMLSEALPIYAGGLGNVAGDQLKAASDLDVPVIGIGLLYSQGYFRQEIDKDGNQVALFPYNDPGQLPVTPLRLSNGNWLRIQLELPGCTVFLRTWQVQVGRLKLYLLDSNDAVNPAWQRGITGQIYGGDNETRIRQEIVLGIGGWKLLRTLGLCPEVCHINEGHAAFVVLERACEFMKSAGVSFEEALAVTRAGNIFTTHTAVASGFDQYPPALMQRYFSAYIKAELNISFEDFMALGRLSSGNTSENFNMAYLAIRGSGAVNAVSRLHGNVSRHLFQPLFPRWPAGEVPVSSVTNGVHMPSWDSQYADEIWTEACGKNRWKGTLEVLRDNIYNLPNERLWEMRNASRKQLIEYVRGRLEREMAGSFEALQHVFDEHVLTLGFARRFVGYKRPTLLLHDEQRLVKLLTNPNKPVQLIIAGKAPPFDEEGKQMIKKWIQFIRDHNLYQHIVFLSDYDMALTEHMVQGVDVWINTPRRPWEGCGTSGMKVLVNGGINLSELDGWWAEAYVPEAGWALGDMQEHHNDPLWDATEAERIYTILEQEVIPLFYERNEKEIPLQWIDKMRYSMAVLTPKFSANRTVREYTENYYIPAAERYLQRAANNGINGTMIQDIHRTLQSKWKGIKIEHFSIEHTANGYLFTTQIDLNKINPDTVLVELYAEQKGDNKTERIEMNSRSSEGSLHVYFCSLSTTRPANDYTIRIIARYGNISVPLENNLIFWQR